MNDRLTALKLFVRTAKTGSFSKAGRDLSLSQPTVSRIIATLERDLDASLFVRTTRLVALTDAGVDYLARVEPILEALEAANDIVGRSGEFRGQLRVSVASSFAFREVIPRLPKFIDQHPSLRVDLFMNDHLHYPGMESVDVAICLGPIKDSAAVVRKISSLSRAIAASPDYLATHGTPRDPDDLALYHGISNPLCGPAGWSFRQGGRVVSVKMRNALSVNVTEGAVTAAAAGIGIISTVEAYIGPELNSGALVRLLPDWEMDDIEVRALYMNGCAIKPAARAFTEFLIAELSNDNDLSPQKSTGDAYSISHSLEVAV